MTESFNNGINSGEIQWVQANSLIFHHPTNSKKNNE